MKVQILLFSFLLKVISFMKCVIPNVDVYIKLAMSATHVRTEYYYKYMVLGKLF